MKIRLILATLGIIAVLASTAALAAMPSDSFNPGKKAEGAPLELAHWGQLVGQWSTNEESLNPSGSAWIPSKGADWDFFWAFDGWGIQDVYTSPSMSQKVEDESKRQRGVNLRIYNAEEGEWVQTWLTPTSKSPKNFSASSSMDELVMLSYDADSRGNYHRITFYEMSDKEFRWKLEWSKDKTNWLEVYRIVGTKK